METNRILTIRTYAAAARTYASAARTYAAAARTYAAAACTYAAAALRVVHIPLKTNQNAVESRVPCAKFPHWLSNGCPLCSEELSMSDKE